MNSKMPIIVAGLLLIFTATGLGASDTDGVTQEQRMEQAKRDLEFKAAARRAAANQAASAKINPIAKPAAEIGPAGDVLMLLSAGYKRDAEFIPPLNDSVSLAQLAQSPDPLVRALAREGLTALDLHKVLDDVDADVNQSMTKAVRNFESTCLSEALSSLGREGKDLSLQQVVQKWEQGMQLNKMQDTVNLRSAITYLGYSMCNRMCESARAIGRQISATAGPARDGAVVARLEPGTVQHPPLVTLTNRSGQPLHHCVIITHVAMDRDRLGVDGDREQAVGVVVLPLLGISGDMTMSSIRQVRLRTNIAGIDKGLMIYLPRIEPGSTVQTIPCAPATFLTFGKSVDVSIWCDELACESIAVPCDKSLADAAQAQPTASNQKSTPGQHSYLPDKASSTERPPMQFPTPQRVRR